MSVVSRRNDRMYNLHENRYHKFSQKLREWKLDVLYRVHNGLCIIKRVYNVRSCSCTGYTSFNFEDAKFVCRTQKHLERLEVEQDPNRDNDEFTIWNRNAPRPPQMYSFHTRRTNDEIRDDLSECSIGTVQNLSICSPNKLYLKSCLLNHWLEFFLLWELSNTLNQVLCGSRVCFGTLNAENRA